MKIDRSELNYTFPASFQPSQLEAIIAAMDCAKSKFLLDLLFKLNEQSEKTGVPIYVVKPDVDTEDGAKIKSRAYPNFQVDSLLYRTSHPTDLLKLIPKKRPGFIIGDEFQMALSEHVSPDSLDIKYVIEILRDWGNHLFLAGLNGDFRGEPMGPMAYIALNADVHHVLKQTCQHHGCGDNATRTQRLLIDGSPAPYTDSVLQPGKRNYRRVCRSHHVVPGKPGSDISKYLI